MPIQIFSINPIKTSDVGIVGRVVAYRRGERPLLEGESF